MMSTVRLLPCPCCGCRDLFAGVMSSSSYGVQCLCGLGVIERIPDEWPPGVWKRGVVADVNIERLHRYVLNQAVEKWNKRVPGGWCTEYIDIEPHIE